MLEGQAAESPMDPCILTCGFPITRNISASELPSSSIYRNQQYLTPEPETLNKDFGYTYNARFFKFLHWNQDYSNNKLFGL